MWKKKMQNERKKKENPSMDKWDVVVSHICYGSTRIIDVLGVGPSFFLYLFVFSFFSYLLQG